MGAIAGFVAAPFIAWQLVPAYMLGVVGMSLLLLARHKPNIIALMKGEERRFGEHNIFFNDDVESLRQRWQSSNTQTVAELCVMSQGASHH